MDGVVFVDQPILFRKALMLKYKLASFYKSAARYGTYQALHFPSH